MLNTDDGRYSDDVSHVGGELKLFIGRVHLLSVWYARNSYLGADMKTSPTLHDGFVGLRIFDNSKIFVRIGNTTDSLDH